MFLGDAERHLRFCTENTYPVKRRKFVLFFAQHRRAVSIERTAIGEAGFGS